MMTLMGIQHARYLLKMTPEEPRSAQESLVLDARRRTVLAELFTKDGHSNGRDESRDNRIVPARVLCIDSFARS